MYEALIGGVLFESDPSDVSRAYVIEPDGLTGWFDAVDVRGESIARPAQHGDFDLPVFRAARMVTISGTVLASSEYELTKMGAVLTGLLADGQSSTLTVLGPDGSTQASVRLSGAPKFAPHPSGLEGDFQIAFKAVDPRRYGGSQSYAGASVEPVNRGNFPASPVVEVAGPRSAPYTITGPGGRVVTVTQALTSAQTHRIDFATGAITRNGVRQKSAISHFQPWTIPARSELPMSISAGSMTVTVTDTYM